MRAWAAIFVLLNVRAKKITKAIDVAGLKLDEDGSESVQFKFKLSKRDRPELQLLASNKWIPLKITISGKNEVVSVFSKARNGGWKRRGKSKTIRYLNNINGDNELIVSFNEKEWRISINGHDVSRNFGIPLNHNNGWKFIRRARAISGYPIRRFTVTQNRQIPEWRAVNHAQCGFNYRLPEEKTDYLRANMPDVFRSMELGMSQLADRCHNNRDGTRMTESRIVGGRPSLPGFYPWMVALRLGTTRRAHNCGASLINRCWVVSAAHCFKDSSLKENYVARVGDYFNRDVEQNQDWSEVEDVHESKLKRVIIHRDYDHSIYNNDIALIELETCVPSLNEFRAPICLPTATAQHGDGECCHIHGWGQLASNQDQLDQFIKRDQEKSLSDPSYVRLYPGEWFTPSK